MLRGWLALGTELVRGTFDQWRSHRSTELAASLAFFGALALAGLGLAAVFAAGIWFSDAQSVRHAAGTAGNVAGSENARALRTVLHAAAAGHDTWIAAVIGGIAFLLAVAGTALQLQRLLDAMWDEAGKKGAREARKARKHAGEFAAIYILTLLLIALLFTGAAVHGLTYHTHRLPALQGTLYQALDVGASIVLLTFVFLFVFAYLPPVDIRWRNVWIASAASAVLYERGQFALAVYFGQMNAASPYADVGAVLAVLVWLYYSAQVVVIGAAFTKTLHERQHARSKRKTHAA